MSSANFTIYVGFEPDENPEQPWLAVVTDGDDGTQYAKVYGPSAYDVLNRAAAQVCASTWAAAQAYAAELGS